MDMATDGFSPRSFCERVPAWAWLAAFVVFATTLPAQGQMLPGVATYRVTFKGAWTMDSTPGGVAPRAYFDRLTGAVHNNTVTFWEPGGVAQRAVELVAELGYSTTFEAVVAANSRNAEFFREDIGKGGEVTATFDIQLTTDRPLFTILSRISPSPDWFVGLSGLSLLDDQNQWLSSHSADLFAYDAGTKDGTEFSEAGADTDPPGTITSLRGVGKFSNEHPMARLTFDLQKSTAPNTAPVFTGEKNFSVQENNVKVGAVQATDGDDADSVTGYTIESGLSGALFSIASTGELTFRVAPNYEDPQDPRKLNIHLARVRVTSGTGGRELSATQVISVTVTDEDGEAPSVPAAPEVTAVSVFMLRATWSAPSNAGPDIDDYDYRYREEGSSAWTEVANTTITELSAAIGGLSAGTAYEVQVRATNAEGSSGWSPSGAGSTPDDSDNDEETTSVEPADREIPSVFALRQNYPNPFNPETTIRYDLPRAGKVRLAVYDPLGHEVAVLVDGSQPAGHYAVRFAADHLPSGLYVYRLQAGREPMARTMLLVK